MVKHHGTPKQSNINDHSEKQFQSIVQQGLSEGGIHANASKGHGKTRLLFSMAQYLRILPDTRVICFDGSEAWLYGFSKIPVFTVGEHDITLAKDIETTEQLERYSLNNWNLVKLALDSEKDILFRLKSRKPSKRGFFIRTVINYLDALQREQRETTVNNQPKQKIAYFIEEAQDAFNVRSTMKAEAEEFLTVFNEGRNNLEAFYTCCQRETDFSKTIRTKQLTAYGKIPESDKTSYHRRLEKQYNVNFSELPQRNWFFEGQTFTSPTWKQQGKPYQINYKIRAKWFSYMPKPRPKPKPKSLFQRILDIFKPIPAEQTENSQEPNLDQSVYNDNPESTQDDDMEEDLGLLEEKDYLW
jgi:hypothetical protein